MGNLSQPAEVVFGALGEQHGWSSAPAREGFACSSKQIKGYEAIFSVAFDKTGIG